MEDQFSKMCILEILEYNILKESETIKSYERFCEDIFPSGRGFVEAKSINLKTAFKTDIDGEYSLVQLRRQIQFLKGVIRYTDLAREQKEKKKGKQYVLNQINSLHTNYVKQHNWQGSTPIRVKRRYNKRPIGRIIDKQIKDDMFLQRDSIQSPDGTSMDAVIRPTAGNSNHSSINEFPKNETGNSNDSSMGEFARNETRNVNNSSMARFARNENSNDSSLGEITKKKTESLNDSQTERYNTVWFEYPDNISKDNYSNDDSPDHSTAFDDDKDTDMESVNSDDNQELWQWQSHEILQPLENIEPVDHCNNETDFSPTQKPSEELCSHHSPLISSYKTEFKRPREPFQHRLMKTAKSSIPVLSEHSMLFTKAQTVQIVSKLCSQVPLVSPLSSDDECE